MRRLIGICLFIVFAFVQGVAGSTLIPVDSLGIKKVKGEKFIQYKVEKGQTWYSLGRKFGCTAKELQEANQNVKSKSLGIGETILIPLNKSQVGEKKSVIESTGKAVYHTVKKGETLYSIAVKSNQSTKDIKHWNNLKSDNLQMGQQLIVGHERKEKGKEKPVLRTHEERHDSSAKPITKKADTALVSDKNKKIEEKMITADTAKKENKEEWMSPVKKGRELEEHGVAMFIEDQDINPSKYYALHRTAPKGTIIKVTNIMNKKQIYVKVIGKLPDTGDNNDLLIKISKASASKLEVLDTRFQVVLNYFGD